MIAPRVLYIASVFPALTVTFIYREVDALRRQDFEILTVSMNRPRESEISEEATPFLDTTLYLDRIGLGRKLGAFGSTMITHPLRMIGCLWLIATARPVKGPRDYARLIYHWIEACFLNQALRASLPTHIHAHFVNGPTSLAMFLAKLSNRPFSFTMHASMIWRDPIALANKLKACSFCVSISEYNRNYVVTEYDETLKGKIHIVRCGVDIKKISPDSKKEKADKLEILAVGQLNARKGFECLLEACSILKQRGTNFHCSIVGDGEERQRLLELQAELELQTCVELVGAKTQEQLPNYLHLADVFALPCTISRDGWRDGIPVALMEAMAWEIPVITTNILGLPELVRHEDTGLLIQPEHPEGLADAIERLHDEPAFAKSLARSGRTWVEEEFNVDVSAQRLAKLFRNPCA